MPGRGTSRFILLALLLVVGLTTYFFWSASVLPTDWASTIKASANSLYTGTNSPPVALGEAEPSVPVPTRLGNTLDGSENVKDTSSLPSEPETVASAKSPIDTAESTPDQLPGPSHRIVYSQSTKNKKYFPILFGDQKGYNPNILPHRSQSDTWIVVAQESDDTVENSVWFAELTCNAQFVDDKLQCIKSALYLPISATYGEGCHDSIAYFGFNVGPHDARAFYGPTKPYVIYGSNSNYTCFGQFAQDLRMLLNWGIDFDMPNQFRVGTELQRPNGYNPLEKNYFLFWDDAGEMYAHHNIAPERVYAKVNMDGSMGPDLAPWATKDGACLEKYLPALAAETGESIHQATNSLAITLCNRSDPTCESTTENTFVFHIFQRKGCSVGHCVYEPYIILFEQTSPFAVHAIGQKPIWINGRGMPHQGTRPFHWNIQEAWESTEMFYVTSMSWKAHGQTYHGYQDDILFINFGIEDTTAGAIDVLAADLLQDLAHCASV